MKIQNFESSRGIFHCSGEDVPSGPPSEFNTEFHKLEYCSALLQYILSDVVPESNVVRKHDMGSDGGLYTAIILSVMLCTVNNVPLCSEDII